MRFAHTRTLAAPRVHVGQSLPRTTDPSSTAPGPRPKVTPLLAVLGLVVLVAVVFAVITLLRYNT